MLGASSASMIPCKTAEDNALSDLSATKYPDAKRSPTGISINEHKLHPAPCNKDVHSTSHVARTGSELR
eukprot:4857985-Amphidinium_carterae.1